MAAHQHQQHRQRMKQRFLKEGLDNFQPHEILEMLLYYTIPQRNTNDIAHNLINKYGSLEKVLQADIDSLIEEKYITENTAVLFKLITQTTKIYNTRCSDERAVLTEKKSIEKFFVSLYVGETSEKLYAVCLDESLRVIDFKNVSEGTSDSVRINIRDIIEFSIKCKSNKIIISHNHPNFDEQPSREDIEQTRRIETILKGIDITLIDHIIVSRDKIFSMRGEGIIGNIRRSFL